MNLLINNAGYNNFQNYDYVTEEGMVEVFRSNTVAPLMVSKVKIENHLFMPWKEIKVIKWVIQKTSVQVRLTHFEFSETEPQLAKQNALFSII